MQHRLSLAIIVLATVLINGTVNAQSPNHRQIKIALPSDIYDTPPSPLGSVSITRRSKAACNEVRVEVANLVARPAGSIFTLYLDTDLAPLIPVKSFNTGGITQSEATERFFCSGHDYLFDIWLDPNNELRAFIIKEAVAGPQSTPPSFCTDFFETGCFILGGKN